jgi:putative transposase
MGTAKSMVVDGQGGPPGVVIAGADVPERRLPRATIEAIVVERPEPTSESPRHLCLARAYDSETGERAAVAAKYTPHIRRIGEEEKSCDESKGHQPRRRVAERTFGWPSKCRGIPARYDKRDTNYLGLIRFSRALYRYRRRDRLRRANANQTPT